MKQIKGYWHILTINHYIEVVSDQLKIMVDSGLYDECENIYVGVLGDSEGLRNVQELFKDYPKIIISEYSTSTDNFEFHTLKILKRQADLHAKEFYGFYIQTKAISYPKWDGVIPNIPNKNGITPEQAYIGGTFIRDYMNYYTLFRWRDNVTELNKGYEVCGTQLRPQREFLEHYSGNFFWFNSEYVKLLKPIEALNRKDRYQAEFWLCSENPIAATLCQVFADYNSKGKFSDTIGKETKPTIIVKSNNLKNKNGRNIVHTLSYNLVSTTEDAVRRMYEMNDKRDFQHIVVDCEYPLLKKDKIPADLRKSKAQNTEALKELALKYGSTYIKIKNEGVSQNWSSIAKFAKLTDDDILCGVDPDELIDMKSGGFIKAMGDVMRADPTYAVTSLIMQEQFAELNTTNSVKRKVAGYNVIDVKGCLMWASIAVSGKFINELGGVPYPKNVKIYGGLEWAMIEHMDRLGYKYCMMQDYLVEHPKDDNADLYRQWKNDSIFGDYKNEKQIQFDAWLEIKRKNK